MTTKKKGHTVRNVVIGAGLAAAAGTAAVLANKKNRTRLEAKAKKTVAKIRSDAKVKEIGNDTADFLTKVSDAIKNFFK